MMKLQIHTVLKSIVMIALLLLVSIKSNEVFATSTPTSADPLGDQLCKIVQIISGKTAKAIGMVAIFFMGIGLFFW